MRAGSHFRAQGLAAGNGEVRLPRAVYSFGEKNKMPGLGTSKQSTQTVQNTQTGPWLPAQNALGNAIRTLEPLANGGSTAPTGAEQNALTQIQNNAAAIPNYTGQATGLLNNLFNGGTRSEEHTSELQSQFHLVCR